MTAGGNLRAFVDELWRAGLRHAVICPGSRSTPLALALDAHQGIWSRVLLDERSAAYFALGMAKTQRRPVALLATSGTAAVNFAPAVVEANLGRVPLLVLTADRPEELQDRGAPQTIDQDHLYGRHAKWFARLDIVGAPEEHVRSVSNRAFFTAAAGPAGPVHLNLPFREPLLPEEDLTEIGGQDAPFIWAIEGRRELDADQRHDLVRRISRVERGLIVAGPLDDPATHEPIAALAAATGFPILADPLSGLRAGGHDRRLVLAHGDHLARPSAWMDAHKPELVIRFGAMPTSKPIVQMICASDAELYVVDGDGGWRESGIKSAAFVHADAAQTATALAAAIHRGNTRWTTDWLAAETAAEHALASWLSGLREPFEGAPWRELGDTLPAGSIVWAGSSMPVRDLDAWFPTVEREIRMLSNRGANGIDGVTSSALGTAADHGLPVVLVTGDLSFLHDIGALVTARSRGSWAWSQSGLRPPDLLVILINNDGGGIFSFLPQATGLATGEFERLFGTPTGIEIGPIVKAFGFEHSVVDGDLRGAIERAIGGKGFRVLELRTDRARNAELHAEAAAAVAETLAATLSGVRP